MFSRDKIGAVMSTTVRFCWLCETPLTVPCGGAYVWPHLDVHYETGSSLWFCSAEHQAVYSALKSL